MRKVGEVKMLDLALLKMNRLQCPEGYGSEIEEINLQDIAIIGMSAALGGAENLAEYWRCLQYGVDCVRSIPEGRQRDLDSYLRYLGKTGKYAELAYLEEIDKFDLNFFKISPREASLMDPHQRLFLETAWQAIEDAGYAGKRIRGSATGIYVGYNGDELYGYKRWIADIAPTARPVATTGNLTPVIAGRLAYLLDLKGPAMMVDTACSSSLVAVHLACQALRLGECDLALAGGVRINMLPLEKEQKLGIESSDGRTKTFDRRSDGTGDGEGVAAILLKPLGKALLDGDHIYALIKGSAVNQDGASIGLTAPNALAQAEVIERAWKSAGIDPETVTYIEAHGTGTKLGDPIEIDGIERAFRRYVDKKQFCAIGSVKTNIGHLDSAAGIAGLLKAVLALQHGLVPPMLHFTEPNQKINLIESPVYIADRLAEWETSEFPRRSGVSSFGLSGTNCHVVLEEAPKYMAVQGNRAGQGYRASQEGLETVQTNQAGREGQQATCEVPYIFTLSAKSFEALARLVDKYARFLCEEISENANTQSLADMCYTVTTGREHYAFRLAMTVKNTLELKDKIKKLTLDLENTSSAGIYYAAHKVVEDNYQKKSQTEVTESERKRLTELAASLLRELAGVTAYDRELSTATTAKLELLSATAYLEAPGSTSGDELELSNTRAQKREAMLKRLCELYVEGADIDWEMLYQRERRQKVSLPSYAFQKTRCWLEVPEVGEEKVGTPNLYYQICWKEEELTANKELSGNLASGQVLLFHSGDHLGVALVKRLRKSGQQVIEVELGSEFTAFSASKFRISGSEEDYQNLLERIDIENLQQIIHAYNAATVGCNESSNIWRNIPSSALPGAPLDASSSASLGTSSSTSLDALPGALSCAPLSASLANLQSLELQRSGLYSLFFLTKALEKRGARKHLEIVILALNANSVTGDERRIIPENAALHSLLKVVNQETQFRCRFIDVDETVQIEDIFSEMALYSNIPVAYRRGVRFLEQLQKLDPESHKTEAVQIKEDGVYVITGGTGGIGLEIAKSLASRQARNLALISRSGVPPRAQWANILTDGTDSKIGRLVEALHTLESNGVHVELYSADVADPQKMAEIFAELRAKYGKINGIVHCAGVAGNGFLSGKSATDLEAVLLPKMQGTLVLDEVTQADQPDFFVLCSSVSSVLGGPSQGDYAAANAYLDSFATYRNRQGKRTLTINWAPWKEVGMAVDYGVQDRNQIFHSLETATAITAFYELLNCSVERAIIGELNYRGRITALKDYLPIQLSPEITALLGTEIGSPDDINNPKERKKEQADVKLTGKEGVNYTETELQLAAIWGQVLGFTELDVHDNFFDLGGDSILIVEMHNLIEEIFPGRVAIADLFLYPTIFDLAQALNPPKPIETESATVTDLDQIEEDILALLEKVEGGDLSLDEAMKNYNSLGVRDDG